MTFIELEEAPPIVAEAIPNRRPTIKCSWCGEVIRLDGKELALAMCQGCYEQMLAEFLRMQQLNQTGRNASER